MGAFLEGDWVELNTTYHSSGHRKGTIGYIDFRDESTISFRPTYHPDGQPVNINNKSTSEVYLNPLPIELDDKDLDALIDEALLKKDEKMFKELWNRRYENIK
ncbi:hypothetical protein ACQKM1_22485 [Peribacillus frigoritolerans]|uniref:hypothetical protein n=1 Tax=Peribacillus frigoritolerans TaxID=450367 RepID=UPI003CFCFFA9